MIEPSALAGWAPLLETLPQGVLVADARGRFVEANPGAVRILGMTRQELLTSGLDDPRWLALAPDGSVLPAEAFPGVRALRSGSPLQQVRMGLVQAGGDTQWLEVSVGPMRDGGVVMTFDDVSARHRSEGILAARARIVELAAGPSTLKEVLRATLDEAERLTGSCIGFYHFVEADQNTLSLQAWSTRTSREFCKAEGHGLHYPVQQAGVWVDALRERKAVVHNDYPSLPHRKGLPEGHAEVLRELVVPVLRGGAVVALLGVGNKPFPYGPSDADLVQRLADLAWETAEHKRTQERLRFEEAALEHSLNAVALADLEGRLRWVNPAFLRLWGLEDRFGVLGMHVADFWADPQAAGAVLVQLVKQGEPVEGDLTARRRDGRSFEVHFTASLAKEANGRSLGVLGTFLDVTESRHLQAVLAENEDRFRRTFDQAPYAAAMVGFDRRIFRVNHAFCAFTGYPESELLGKTYAELTHPEDLPRDLENVQRMLEGGQDHYETRKRYLRKDGGTAWGHLHLRMVRGAKGEPLYMLPMIEDITARWQAEQGLRAREADLREAQRLVHLGSWKWTIEGDLVEWSEELFRISGRDPAGGAPSYQELSACYTAESWERLAAAVAQAVADGTPYGLDLDLVRTDGEIRHTHSRGEIDRGLDGRVVGLHGTVQDITAQKQAEAALRDSEARFNTAFQLMPVALGITRYDDRTFLAVNRAFTEIYGYSADELRGRNAGELGIWADPGDREEVARRLASGQPVADFETRVRRKDGSLRTVSYAGELVTLGGVQCLFSAAVDITARRQAERELHRIQEVLAEFVRHSPIHAYIKEVELGQSRVLIASDNFEEMIGIPGREMTGRTMAELFPAEFAAKITADDWAVASSGKVVQLEEELNGRSYQTIKFPITREGRTLLAGYTIDLTDRIRAERELRQRTEELEAYFSHGVDLFVIAGTDGRFRKVNRAWEETLGYSVAELEGAVFLELVHPEDRAATVAAVAELAAGRPVVDFVNRYRHREGGWRWIEWKSSAQGDTIFAAARDITTRLQAESEIRETRDLLRLVLDSLRAHVAVLDPSGWIQMVNEPWRRFARENGIREPVGAVEQVNYLEVVRRDPNPDAAAIHDGLLAVLRGERPSYQGTYPCDGPAQRRRFRMLALPLRAGNLGAIVTHEDITAEWEAVQALEASEARARSMLATALDAVWLLDDAARIIEVNEAACGMHGWPREEMLGRTPADFEATENPAQTEEHTARIQRQGADLFESMHRRRDGSVFPVEVSVTHQPAQGRMVAFIRDITARKQTEAVIEASEARLRAIWDAEPECVKLVSPEGILLDMNPAGLAMLEVDDPAQAIGKPVIRMVLPEHHATFLDIARRAFAEGSATGAFEIRGLKGTRRWMETHAVPLQAASGPLLLAVTRDVSFSKQAEEALRQSEERYRMLSENAGDVIWLLDLGTGRFAYVSPSVQRLRGFTPEEVIGQPVESALTPESAAQVDELLAVRIPAFRPEDPATWTFTDEVDQLRKDGTVVPTEVTTRYIAGEDGRITHILGVSRDISERRRADAALRKAWAAVEQSPVIIVIADTQGCIEYVNPAFTEHTGYTPAESLGRNPRFLKSGLHPPEFYRQLWDTLTAGRAWRGRLCNRRKDGQLYWEQATISPVRDAAGRTTHYVAAKENITEALRLEEERRLLEQQVARTQKLESLGSLAGGVAHDMNNVLAAILSLASVHQMTAVEGTPLRTNMDTIAKACLRGRTLVQGLLGFARQELAEEQVLDLNVLVREEVTLLERTTLQKVALELDLAADLRPVKGDPSALSHALMNLCVNAVDAMPEGGKITLRTNNFGNAQVLLEVADTGSGMPREVLEKAMDPFFTTKPQGKGTGLGLPIVYGTVKAHHGQIELHSAPGEGTTVSIRLPAAPTAAPAPAAGESGPVAQSGLRVLVVDDDELIQQSAAQLLEALGHQPTVVGRGEDALAWLQGGQPCDLVILDLNMPGLGGAATLPRIRSLRPLLRVLLATGRADQEAIDLAASVPRTTLLAKPYALADLRRELARPD